jgi:hypothetical protein
MVTIRGKNLKGWGLGASLSTEANAYVEGGVLVAVCWLLGAGYVPQPVSKHQAPST